MTTWLVDDDGSSTSPFETWAKAASDLPTLITSVGNPGAGDIIVFGHNTVDSYAYSANYTLTGPTGLAPAILISCTQGTGSAASGLVYQLAAPATADRGQIDTDQAGGITARAFEFDGCFALYGIEIRTGTNLTIDANTVESFSWIGGKYLCDFSTSLLAFQSSGIKIFKDLTIDCMSGTNGNHRIDLNDSGVSYFQNITFENASSHQGNLIQPQQAHPGSYWTGCDFSDFSHVSFVSILRLSASKGGQAFFENCKMPSTLSYAERESPTTLRTITEHLFTGCGNGNNPENLYYGTAYGEIQSSTGVYRNSGATYEGTSVSWGGPTTGILTEAACSYDTPLVSPWIYFNISSTGSTTFDLYIGNNTEDLDKHQIWSELEIKADASSGEWTTYTNREDKYITPTDHSDDSSSTWTGDTLTYMQKLTHTETVNTTGVGRMRVCIAEPSLVDADDLYIDPLVTVT